MQRKPPDLRRLAAEAAGFLALAGLLPAIMTGLIAPPNWLEEIVLCDPCLPPALEPPGAGLTIYVVVALTVFAAGLGLALWRRDWKGAAMMVPALLFAVKGWIAWPSPLAGELLYAVSSTLVFLALVLARAPLIRTPFFWAFVLLMLVMLKVEPQFGLGRMLFFLTGVFVARVVYRFVQANLDLFVAIGVGRSLALLGKSLVLMTPILVLIGAVEWGRSSVESWLDEALYTSAPLCDAGEWRRLALEKDATPGPGTCPEGEVEDRGTRLAAFSAEMARIEQRWRDEGATGPEALRPWDRCVRLAQGLQQDLCYYTEYLFAYRTQEMRAALEAVASEAGATAADVNAAASRQVDRAFADVRIPRPKPCPGLRELLCTIARGIVGLVEESINKLQARTRSELKSGFARGTTEGSGSAREAAVAAEARLTETMDAQKREVHAKMQWTFDAARFLNDLFFVLFLLAFVKSLLFIFARVLFASADGEAAIRFADVGETLPRGAVRRAGQSFTLGDGERIYYARQAQVEGIAPRLAWPQPLACVLARVASGVWLMNRADMARAAEGRIVFKTGDVREFVEWRLAPGEEVMFHFRDFIAMDSSVSLSTHASFRVPTLLMGRLFFRVARGPGRLLLRTDGAAEVTGEGDAALSKPVHRFVAWNRAACFRLDAELSLVDIYLSGVHFRKGPGDLVVFVAEAGDKRRIGRGAARFFKDFLLPV